MERLPTLLERISLYPELLNDRIVVYTVEKMGESLTTSLVVVLEVDWSERACRSGDRRMAPAAEIQAST